LLRRIAVQWSSIQAFRNVTILGLDAIATACALYAALFLRLDWRVPLEYTEAVHIAVPVLVGVRFLTVLGARLHRWSFRMSGLAEAVRLVLAMVAGSALFLLVFHYVSPHGLPRTVYALEFFFATSLMAGLRFAPRLAASWYSEQRRKGTAPRTIIVGAGGAGELLARDLIRTPDSKYWVVGFVDDAPAKLGTLLHGKRVLGTIDALPEVIEAHEIGMVLLAIPRLPAVRIREILDICGTSKVSFKIVPASFACLDGKVSAAMLHDLSPEDLLPRDAIAFDHEEIRSLVQGRRALVTGAGGSIGGEICRQLASHGVAQLVMVDMNENEMYLGARRLQAEYPHVRIHAEVADIREPARLMRLGLRYRPEHVFHAAAHKHVPLMEDAPEEAVKNNVFGTLNVAAMAHECGVERLVVISTDKAVRPTSVMGATKRIAELAVRELARGSRTKMTAVRFGNVLGSAGSVVPIFKEQISLGGPVTVTHPDCTRYFMTIPEAVGLVLLAGLGGYGDLCVLDMGEPIRIADMARNLITMAGCVPGEDIEIVYTGLRPGEKMYEELLTEEEEQTHEVRDRIMVAKSPAPPLDLQERLRDLRRLADAGDREGLLRGIKRIVPTYRFTPAQPLVAARGAVSALPDAALAAAAQLDKNVVPMHRIAARA
jgi:FlaA1/EpsC-like NDP-sugar epimerase